MRGRRRRSGWARPFFLVPYVPWVELAVGAALIAQVAKPIPQFVAIMLLLLFSALIAKRLSEGRRPPCACFGAWSAKPIGPEHLARNAVLLVLGVLALLREPAQGAQSVRSRNDSTRASSRQAS